MPKEIGKDRPCLYHQINQCDAPCQNYISREEYRKYVDKALKLSLIHISSILGHMQRGGNPTAKDRVYASYMGALAVDLLCSGATNRVVGYRNGQYIDYDIEDALGMAKDVDQYEFEIAQILGRSYKAE